MRYLVPVLLFGVAGFVWHYNGTHEDSWLLFPLLDLIPPLAGDRDAQAQWSWRIFAGLGALVLIANVLGDLRRARVPRAKVDEE
ncbi:MAG: hypothetical protein KF729_28315 [Sandaracinaceae bacterium]|nr:hypothetical protein [Sandaracinaceae bacterium]